MNSSTILIILLLIPVVLFVNALLNAMEEVKDREREQRQRKASAQAEVEAQALRSAGRRTPRWEAAKRHLEESRLEEARQGQLEEARRISEEEFRQRCEKEAEEQARLRTVEEMRRAEVRKANYRRLNKIKNRVGTATLRSVDIVVGNTVIGVRRACDFVDTKVREREQRKRNM